MGLVKLLGRLVHWVDPLAVQAPNDKTQVRMGNTGRAATVMGRSAAPTR